jgi:hypothetical protein
MNDKAQVTTFIVMGLLLLVFVALFATLIADKNIQTLSVDILPDDSAPLQTYVTSCLDSVTEEALVFIGLHGGYFVVPSDAHEKIKVPYYIDGDVKKVPSIEVVEEQLQLYIQVGMYVCLDNFESFKKEGYTIEEGAPLVDVDLLPRKVLVSAQVPLMLQNGEKSIQLEKSTVEVPSRLFSIHAKILGLTASDRLDGDSFCLTCFFWLMEDFKVEMMEMGDQTTLVSIIDEEVLINGEPYTYHFLYKIKEREV